MTVLVGLVAADIGAEVKSFKSDVSPDGTYVYAFDTTNGIAISESGSPTEVHGSFEYVSPEGTAVKLVYTADENGFHPEGAHLPVAPEIPAHIVKALEYIRAHPPKE